jgi:phosphatidylserine synthase
MKSESKKISKYWFKRRRYGYGWVPFTWQGWLVVIAYVGSIFLATLIVKDIPSNTYSSESVEFTVVIVLSTIALIFITNAKGPRPKWRWGKKPGDNPDEDF